MMQFVHRELHGTPIFKSVKKYLTVVHEKGLGNLMGDAASRARIDVLKATAAAMRIKCVQLKVPRHAVDFIGRACAYFRSLSLEEQGRAVSQPQNPNPASFAMQMLDVPNMVPNEPLLSVHGDTNRDACVCTIAFGGCNNQGCRSQCCKQGSVNRRSSSWTVKYR